AVVGSLHAEVARVSLVGVIARGEGVPRERLSFAEVVLRPGGVVEHEPLGPGVAVREVRHDLIGFVLRRGGHPGDVWKDTGRREALTRDVDGLARAARERRRVIRLAGGDRKS